MTWYVVRTKPRQETRARQNLENQEIEAFLPEITLQKIRRGKRTAVTEPLFPGYIFANLDDYAGKFHKVRSTFGVAKMLTFGETPATIPDALIQEMHQINADTQQKAQQSAMPQVGEKVEITYGPFKGFMAEIVQLDGESRCIVLLNWLQKEVKATLEFNEIRRS
ncbi:transcription/translation regulatory transformer protein RfaH [Pseudidiomarina woesei]|uniref:Transcription elongation factor/antiterminator RfaH n=1 Tax=Pseudidiomarina woesei TaxID=1381080 RepID=A0A0K6H6T1_9GAMM|nr:transcription/translation regulatory transformer protein RfaH [Pseudidiomarina woesei]CUA86457.1 transcription elongation factor/antiterminator RfaH [Pseudidiomarina woesei]